MAIISDNNCGDRAYTDKKVITLDGLKTTIQINDETPKEILDFTVDPDPYEPQRLTYSTSSEALAATSLNSGMYPPGFFGSQPSVGF